MLIVPKITTGTLGAQYGAGALPWDTWQSPFTSSPSTAAPFGWLQNFNVILSGANLYQQNLNMSWEFFLREVHSLKNVDGGLDLTHGCGLISKTDWESAPFYVVNLARQSDQAHDDISRSVQVTFTNASALTMDYSVIIVYQKELTIQTSTGTLIM